MAIDLGFKISFYIFVIHNNSTDTEYALSLTLLMTSQ